MHLPRALIDPFDDMVVKQDANLPQQGDESAHVFGTLLQVRRDLRSRKVGIEEG